MKPIITDEENEEGRTPESYLRRERHGQRLRLLEKS